MGEIMHQVSYDEWRRLRISWRAAVAGIVGCVVLCVGMLLVFASRMHELENKVLATMQLTTSTTQLCQMTTHAVLQLYDQRRESFWTPPMSADTIR